MIAAKCYETQGKPFEAMKYYEQCRAIHEVKLGYDHKKYLLTLS